MAKIQKKSKQQFHLIPFFYFPPKDCPSGSHQTIFPQKPTQPNHLCASVKSVGGSSPPEASVYSVNSVGGLAQTNLEWVLWKEFGGRRGYGRDAIPSYENSHRLYRCAQIRRVWHPCHTHAATKLSSHRIHGTHRNNWRRRKNLCTSVQSVGGYSPPETSVNSVNSVGGLAQTNLEWVLWKEFGGRRGYGRDAIPSYENSHGLHGCAQIRRQNAT